MHLSFSSLKPLWSRLRLSRSFESKPQARAGSRTAKPLTLNTIAAAAVSEDSLPFAEPKSPRGAPKGGTHTPFNIHPVGHGIEGAPKSVNSDNKKGKGKNGGSNDASSRSGRTTLLVPAVTGSHRGNSKSRNPSASNTPTSSPSNSPEPKKGDLASGNKSRDPSASNTPTSSPSNSPEPKKENLSRDINRVVTDGPTNTENQKHSPKQSTDASPTPLPSRNFLHRVFSPAPKPTPNKTAEPSSPENASGLADKDKQDDVKPAAPLSSNPLTPPASPEIQNLAVQADLENRHAASNSLPETTSDLADLKHEQDNVKPAAPLSSNPLTPPASPETRKLAVQADLGNGPSALNSLPETASGLAELKDEQDNVKPAAGLSSSPLTPPASPQTQNLDVQADLENGPASLNSLPENTSGSAELKDEQNDVKSAALLSSDPPTTLASPAVPEDLEDRPAPSLPKAASVSPDKAA